MRQPALIKRYFPIFVTIAIFIVAGLIYLDKKNTDFSPYVDLTLNVHWDQDSHDFEPVDLVRASDEADVGGYHLGFITDAGKCNPAWGGQPDFSVYHEWAKHAIEAVIANEVEVTITLGNRNGIDISAACTNKELFIAYENIVHIYQPRRLDFDIENNTANVEKIISVLTQLKETHPNVKISFTLLTLPEKLLPYSENVLRAAKAANLDYSVNLLVMNYGPSYPGNMAHYAIQASEYLHDFLQNMYPQKTKVAIWRMVELTPMIGLNDVAGEQFTLQDADTITNFAKHFNLGGTSMKLANRDFPCAMNTVTNYCSGNNLQTKPYEFETHFLK